jgi:excinuclease ABC subunit A
LQVLGRLRDGGNTVLVIEHNLDVIKTADHIIDLGPEGGDGGGMVVAQGTPEKIAASGSYTGEFLKEVLNENSRSLNKEIEERKEINESMTQNHAK